MNQACEKSGDSPMPITFLGSPLNRRYPVSLVIPKPGSFGSPDGKKNNLRKLWDGTPDFLRPQAPLGPRPFLWRHAHLSRTGDPACFVQKLRQGEAGEVCLPGQQSVLHQAICLLRWQALQHLHGKDVAQELHLDRKTVNALEKQYMREKLRRAGNPKPKTIGIDEISIS